jgi:hypothetical protein
LSVADSLILRGFSKISCGIGTVAARLSESVVGRWTRIGDVGRVRGGSPASFTFLNGAGGHSRLAAVFSKFCDDWFPRLDGDVFVLSE